MENIPEYYVKLFNAVTNAVAAMDQLDFGEAKSLLVQAQRDAEDAYIEAET